MRWAPAALLIGAAVAVSIGSYDYLARLKVEASVEAELQDAKPRKLRRILREYSEALLPVRTPSSILALRLSLAFHVGCVPRRQTVPTVRGAFRA